MQALCLNVQPTEKKDRDGVPQTMEDFFQLLADDEELEKEVADYESIELTFDDYDDNEPVDVIEVTVDDEEEDM